MPGPNDGVLPPVGSNERDAYDRQQRAINTSNQNTKSMYNDDGSYDYGRIGGRGYLPSGTVDYATTVREAQTQRQKDWDARKAFLDQLPGSGMVSRAFRSANGGNDMGPRPVVVLPAEQQSSSPATPSGNVDYATALRQGQTQRQKEYDDREAFINSPLPQLVNSVIQADGGTGFQQGPRPVITPAGQPSPSPAFVARGSSGSQLSDPRIERLRNKAGNSRPQMQNSNAGIAQRSNRRYGTQQADARGGGRRNKAGQDIPNTNRNAPAPGTVAQGQFKA